MNFIESKRTKTATYIAVKYMTSQWVLLTLDINSHGLLLIRLNLQYNIRRTFRCTFKHTQSVDIVICFVS